MSPGAPRAGVIFDLDGVLIDSERLQFAAYRQVLAEFDVEISADEYAREWIAKGNGPEYAVAHYDLGIEASELRRRKNPVYLDLLREQVTLMPGAEAALSRLGQCFPLALATNSSAVDAGYVLDRFGLRSRFTEVVTRERYANPKPAADAFATAAGVLGLPPASCVVIEDAYKGVLAAHRAGCPCVVVPNDLTRGNDFALAARAVDCLDAIGVDLIMELAGEVSPAAEG